VNAKFHKVVYRHYSREVENIYITFLANLLRTIHTKFYQNAPGFVKDMTKNLVCFLIHSVQNKKQCTQTKLNLMKLKTGLGSFTTSSQEMDLAYSTTPGDNKG